MALDMILPSWLLRAVLRTSIGCDGPFGAASQPGPDLGFKAVATGDAAVKTLAAQEADLDLDHIEPIGVLGRVVELQTSQNPALLGGWEGLIDGGGRVG
jgi:hypothetical protein